MLSGDLDGIERRLQAVSRQVFGRVLEQVVAMRAGQPRERPPCPACGGLLRLVDQARPRQLQGLIGDATVQRPTYVCTRCRPGHAPLDAELGLGQGALTPALARVACRAGIETSFGEASDLLAETLGVAVPSGAVRRGPSVCCAGLEAAEEFWYRGYALVCAWLSGGLYLDGWAHHHVPNLETFFTPWHAVLYSGYAAVAAVLVIALLRNHARGYPWERALPPGYEVSLLGAAIFAVGGQLDLLWHTLFGIEVNVAALLSPTHLILATGGVLMITGPLRAAWRRLPHDGPLTWKTGSPALLSSTLILAVLAFFTQFAHPFVDNWAAPSAYPGIAEPYSHQALGVAGILLQAALLMGVILLLVRHWVLPLGALTLVVALPAILISFMQDTYQWILPALVAGLLADLLLRLLQPSAAHPGALRIFAFAVPAILFGLYFVSMIVNGSGIGWSVHLWVGSAVMAGAVGVLLSYLAVPPRLPSDEPVSTVTPES